MIRHLYFRQAFFVMAILFALLITSPLLAAEKDTPIFIEADSMSSTEKSNSVNFKGSVKAKQGDVQIRSDEMTVYYAVKGEKDTKGDNTAQRVEKLICRGNVEITRSDWIGTAKRMDYLAQKRQILLIGTAKAYQGQNMVSGEKIIYYINDGRSEVVGDTQTTLGDTHKKKPSRVKMTIMQQ